jgi:hypothetical protein
MAKVLNSISRDAPAAPVSAAVNDTFAFSGTPGFTGTGGVQRYDFKWEVDSGGGYVTIGASGTGLITAGTNPVVNTNSQAQQSITVTCDQAGSYTIRMVGAPTSGGSYTVLSSTQTVEVSAPANVIVEPGVASLTLTGQTPTVNVSDHQTVTPGSASLALTAFAPTVTATANQSVTPGAAVLALATFAPTVTGGSGITVTPGLAELILALFAPVVTATNHQTVVPGPLGLTLTGFTPSVTTTANVLVTPNTTGLILTGFSPLVTGDAVDVEIPAMGQAGSYRTLAVAAAITGLKKKLNKELNDWLEWWD